MCYLAGGAIFCSNFRHTQHRTRRLGSGDSLKHPYRARRREETWRGPLLIQYDFQMIQVEFSAADHVHAQGSALAAAKEGNINTTFPSARPTATDYRREDELKLGAGEGSTLAQQPIGRHQVVGDDLVELPEHHAGFAETGRRRIEPCELLEHRIDDTLADGEFVHAANVTKQAVPVNRIPCPGSSSNEDERSVCARVARKHRGWHRTKMGGAQ